MLFQLISSEPLYFISCCFIFGLLVGSFLNVVIYRLPVMMQQEWEAEITDYLNDQAADGKKESSNQELINQKLVNQEHIDQAPFNLVVPRSRCGHCGTLIKAWQNIPVLSYLLLRGKCGHCQQRISLRYPMIELFTGCIAAVIAWQFQSTPVIAIAGIFLAFALIALFWIDFDTYLLPDSITIPLVWLGLIVNSQGWFTDLHSAVFGAIAGYMLLWSVFWLFKITTGKEGMGYGDFKLLAALGAWLGWQMLPMVIILSSFAGAAIGIALIIFKGHNREKPIPFGPYLALAGLLALMYGEQINQAYLNLLT